VAVAADADEAEKPLRAPLVDEMVAATGKRAGLCVVPCCRSRELLASLLRQSDFFVHVLVSDAASLHVTRQEIESTGAYGRRASAEVGSLSRLPYPDYCANLLVCDFSELPREDMRWSEIVRVLRPGGLAYVGQSAETARAGRPISAETLRAKLTAAGVLDFEIIDRHGVWARIRRTRPAGMGQWSHGRWGTPGNNPCVADSLIKAPFHTLWIGEPNGFTKFGLPLVSGGRVLLRYGGITYEGRYKPSEQPDLIQAFDAYNGAPLWQRRLDEPEGDGFVAVGNRVFAAGRTSLVGLESEDGSVTWRLRAEDVLTGTKSWGRYRCADNVLVAAVCDERRRSGVRRHQRALVGLSPEDGSVLWKLEPDGGVGSFALGEGLCFHSSDRNLVAIRIADAQEVWRRTMAGSGQVRYSQGMVYTDSASYAASDGSPGRRGNYRGVLVGDRLYAGGMKGLRVTSLTTGEATESFPVPRDPYCPKTGIPDGCSYMYGRCIMPTASTNCYFFSYGGTVIGDLIRNELFPCESFRSNCRTGVIAGEGLVYNSPSGCGCSFQVRGGTALVPVDESIYRCRPESNPSPQLEKGPAFADEITPIDARDAWPCFRHDPARSAVTEVQVGWPVDRKWQTKLPGKLTPPVVAGGTLFVGSDNHSVYALDTGTGEVCWRFVTGGEVWSSPAWWQGRLYTGSQDGWVYCLRADDGRLVWRFRGAPHDRKMIYYGRPQSVWPVAGGVIVEDGTAQFYAGRCSHDRVFVWSLDARTGKILWKNDRAGRAVNVTGSAGGISPHGVSPSGVLAASKQRLYVPQGPYAPAAFARDDGRILWWGRRGDSTQRSNIEVQNLGGPNLVVADNLLLVGGPNSVTGASQSFVALDARSGRMWGADDPRLFAKAGRDAAGKAVEVKRSLFGTRPIRFGRDYSPVVVDSGVLVPGYRGDLFDLKKYLQTQFGAAAADARLWSTPLPSGTLLVCGNNVLIASDRQLTALSRSDGSSLGRFDLGTDGTPLSDGVAVAEDSIFIVTSAGELVCFGDERTALGGAGDVD
jgi:outer membrane protein assembly factor BamB